MARKGISPILAAVLLFAVTVSVVGIFANFAPNLINTVTSETDEQTQAQIECEGAGMSFQGVNYDSSTNTATYVLRNTGNANLDDVIVVSFDSDNTVLKQNQSLSVFQGNLTEVTQYPSTQPSYVQAFSRQCGSIEIEQDIA